MRITQIVKEAKKQRLAQETHEGLPIEGKAQWKGPLEETPIPHTHYGYWISPTGEVTAIDKIDDHLPVIFHKLFPKKPFPKGKDAITWAYEDILSLGYIRVVASSAYHEFDCQLKLETLARPALSKLKSVVSMVGKEMEIYNWTIETWTEGSGLKPHHWTNERDPLRFLATLKPVSVIKEAVDIPETPYGYWITPQGKFDVVAPYGHDDYLFRVLHTTEYGKAYEKGYIRIVDQGRGVKSNEIDIQTGQATTLKAKFALQALIRQTHKDKFYFDQWGPGMHDDPEKNWYHSKPEILRALNQKLWKLNEDGSPIVSTGPTNSAGRGGVVGIGIGPFGQPGIDNSDLYWRRKKWPKLFTRGPLNELADAPLSTKVLRLENDVESYQFVTPNGQTYLVRFFEDDPESHTWSLTFFLKDKSDGGVHLKTTTFITGTGEEIKVFSTVANLFFRWDKKHPDAAIEFSAHYTEPSRIKLYHKFAQLMAQKTHRSLDIFNNTSFVLSRKSLNTHMSETTLPSFSDFVTITESSEFARAGERNKKNAVPGQLHPLVHKHLETLIDAAYRAGKHHGTPQSAAHMDALDQAHDAAVEGIRRRYAR